MGTGIAFMLTGRIGWKSIRLLSQGKMRVKSQVDFRPSAYRPFDNPSYNLQGFHFEDPAD